NGKLITETMQKPRILRAILRFETETNWKTGGPHDRTTKLHQPAGNPEEPSRGRSAGIPFRAGGRADRRIARGPVSSRPSLSLGRSGHAWVGQRWAQLFAARARWRCDAGIRSG